MPVPESLAARPKSTKVGLETLVPMLGYPIPMPKSMAPKLEFIEAGPESLKARPKTLMLVLRSLAAMPEYLAQAPKSSMRWLEFIEVGPKSKEARLGLSRLG